MVFYTAPTTGVPGKLKVTLTSSIPTGVTQVGEVATITLQLTNAPVPTVGSFGLTAVSVYDVTVVGPISGMGAIVASVLP